MIWWGGPRGPRSTTVGDRSEQRRWQGYRLEKFDKADEERLLRPCLGDRPKMESLVHLELERDPAIGREQAIADALGRWRRDLH